MQIYPNTYVQSNDNISISSFYFQDRVNDFSNIYFSIRKLIPYITYLIIIQVSRRSGHNQNRAHSKPNYKNYHSMVTIYDASSLFFVNKELAEKYMQVSNSVVFFKGPAECNNYNYY
jgi:hypothetical protein